MSQELPGGTPTRGVGWVLLLAVLCATLGGYLCGLAVQAFGTAGFVSVWALGVMAGFVARKILATPSRLAGWVLVVACVGAVTFAVVCWLHWCTVQGEESWWVAFTCLPVFVKEFYRAAMFAALFTAIGAWSAYSGAAIRYRMVRVREESGSEKLD